MGTVAPSGVIRLAGAAVRVTLWATARLAPRRRTVVARIAVFRLVLRKLNRIAALLVVSVFRIEMGSKLVGFIDHKLPGVHQHHHHHSAGEDVVGGNFALVVRVPHESETSLIGGRVGNSARWRNGSGGADCANGCIRTQVGAAAVPGAEGHDVGIRQTYRTATCDVAERIRFQWLVVILAPLEIVNCGRGGGVVAVAIWNTTELGVGVGRSRIVAVRVPIEALAGPVVDAVHGRAWRGGGSEERRTSEAIGIGGTENQVAVATQNANVVAVLVEGVLHAALADDAQKDQLTWMEVRIAVVRLMGVLGSVVGVHVIRHGAPVDQEIDRMVRLGRDIEAASGSSSHAGAAGRYLLFRIAVNDGIHFGKLEQVFAVVAGFSVVVGRMRQTEVGFVPESLCSYVVGMDESAARSGIGGRGQYDDGAVEAHLDLQVALRSAVVRVRATSCGGNGNGICDGAGMGRFLRQQTSYTTSRSHRKPWEQDRGVAGCGGKAVRQRHGEGTTGVDDERWARELHGRAVGARHGRQECASRRSRGATVTPGVNQRAVGLRGISRTGG